MNYSYEMMINNKQVKEGVVSVFGDSPVQHILQYLFRNMEHKRLNGVKVFVNDALVYSDEVVSGRKVIAITRKPVIKKMQGRPQWGDGKKAKKH